MIIACVPAQSRRSQGPRPECALYDTTTLGQAAVQEGRTSAWCAFRLGRSRERPIQPRSKPARSVYRAGVERCATLKQACSPEYQGAQGAFKDSMIHWVSAIHITFRVSLRSSSMREPRDPLLKVVITCLFRAYITWVDKKGTGFTGGKK